MGVEENHDHGDVVHDLLLLFPKHMGLPHQFISRSFRAILDVKRQDHVADLLIRQEFPESVAANHHKAIVRAQEEFKHLGSRTDAHTVSHFVTH